MSQTSLYGGAVHYNAATHTYSVATSIATKDLNSLISGAEKGAVIQFGEGTYTLTSSLCVTRSDITLKGAGEDLTILRAEFSAPSSLVYIGGTAGWGASITQTATVDSHSITVSSTNGYHVGDIIRVSQINDAAFMNTALPGDINADHYLSSSLEAKIENTGLLYGNINASTAASKPELRVTLTEIERIEGNTIYLKDGLAYGVTGGVARTEAVNALENVTFSGFTITNNIGAANPTSATNAYGKWAGVDAIRAIYTDEVDINHVKIVNTPSNGLTIMNSYGAQVDSVEVQGALNKGDGGNGYGLNLANSQQGLFTNITINDTRHGVLFSSWGAEVGNVIQVTETNRDINYHGSPDYNNVVIVEKSVISSVSGISNTPVGTFAAEHAYTDISANTTLFAYAIGSGGADVIHGVDGGAYISGKSGNDWLYGGAGDDVIDGGYQEDKMWGGAGADMFVFNNNDGTHWKQTDRIYDFNAVEGDKLVIHTDYYKLDPSKLKIEAVGNDTQVFIDNHLGYILLVGVKPSDVPLSSIILNDKTVYSTEASDYFYSLNEYYGIVDKAPAAIVAIDPSKIFASTNKAEIFTGGSGDDTVNGWVSAFTGDTYNMGAGNDKITITASEVWAYANKLPTMTGVDVIDVSPSTKVLKIGITDAIVDQSDHDVLTLHNGAAKIEWLSADIKNAAMKLVVSSQGDIFLADKVNNAITLADDNKGVVHGGTGNDTITLGKGVDVLYGGAGKDTFVLGLNSGDAPDIIKDFDVKSDKLDLKQLISDLDPTQHAINDFLQVSHNDKGQAVLQADADGAGTAQAMHTIAVFEGVKESDLSALVAKAIAAATV